MTLDDVLVGEVWLCSGQSNMGFSLSQTDDWDNEQLQADMPEMRLLTVFTVASDVAVYFCDPHSPWQRGSNENTNGLLRQYFPKSTDLSAHGPDHLDLIADRLNNRPRKRHGYRTPAEVIQQVLSPPPTGVAPTT